MLQINQIHCLDVRKGLKQLPDESVDCVVTSPPYWALRDYGKAATAIWDAGKKCNHRWGQAITRKRTGGPRGAKVGNHQKRVGHFVAGSRFCTKCGAWRGQFGLEPNFDLYLQHLIEIFDDVQRVLKKGGTLYMFTAKEDNGFFIRKARERGFTFKTQLAIIKKTPQPSFFKNKWRGAFELCLCVTKDKPKTFNFLSQQECIDVFPYLNTRRETLHPTEKPLEFIKRIIRVSSNPGDVVLDPFMGSGTTAVACKELQRRFVGFELNKGYIKMANERMQRVSSAKEAA